MENATLYHLAMKFFLLRRYLFAVSLACATFGAYPHVWAQTSSDEATQAKELFKQAEVHFGLGEFEKALEFYREAYALKPLPGFHFNIAQCFRNLGNHQKALFHYKQYLALVENPANKADVETLIRLCEQTISDQEQEKRRAEIAAMAPSQPAPPSTATLSSDRTETPSEKTATPQRSERDRKQNAPSDTPDTLSPIYFWSVAGSALALTTLGTISGIVALNKSATYRDPNTPSNTLSSIKSSGETWRTLSWVAWSGAAFAAGGAVWLFFKTEFRRNEQGWANRITAIPLDRGAAISMQGRF